MTKEINAVMLNKITWEDCQSPDHTYDSGYRNYDCESCKEIIQHNNCCYQYFIPIYYQFKSKTN